jgi:NADP-dependent 3-hydroxy acid dehydrogenase YdfG
MPFPFKHVLLIGATSGIGRAMGDHFIAQGIKVTAIGRREERLEEFVAQHGNDKASSITFDIGKLEAIPAFIERYVPHSLLDHVRQSKSSKCFQDPPNNR